MSKQWGSGFYAGKISNFMETVKNNRSSYSGAENGLSQWIPYLEKGGKLCRADWDWDSGIRLAMDNGDFFIFKYNNECGRIIPMPYKIKDDDMNLEWFGEFGEDEELQRNESLVGKFIYQLKKLFSRKNKSFFNLT